MPPFNLIPDSVDPYYFSRVVLRLPDSEFIAHAPRIFEYAKQQFPHWFKRTPARAVHITKKLLEKQCDESGKREREYFLLCVSENLLVYAERIKSVKIDNTNSRKLSHAIDLLEELIKQWGKKGISSASMGPILTRGVLILGVKKDQISEHSEKNAAHFFNSLVHASNQSGDFCKSVKDIIRQAYAENYKNDPAYWLSLIQKIICSEKTLTQIKKYCDGIFSASICGNQDQVFVTRAAQVLLNILNRHNLKDKIFSVATSEAFSPFIIAAGPHPGYVAERMGLISMYMSVSHGKEPIMCREGLVLRPDDAHSSHTVIWGPKKAAINELSVCHGGIILNGGDYFMHPVQKSDRCVVEEWMERRHTMTNYKTNLRKICGVK